ncbi:HdeD family acid-resistance protein [Subtercola boreus]|uniref:HdeD family acid-resistance protein n=1 Tax=Subtercola boreus TaxID=120213 RepID=A0A3E0WB08_9MICO|nr:DUF308 domain-containing protein [Subtercola boreus]RFA21199.1 hypothetical protein B7R24_07370 [Subtercola boreus]RFA21582.1 hypothetical protein B7R23_07315 [Subtercola boreus]RFA27551.1 hypothetical protein B7R25_07440 [Subtercola boreus]
MSTPITPLRYSFHADELTGPALRTFGIALWIGAVLSILVGIVVLAWPGSTLEVVAFFFGLYFFVVGLVRVFVGIVNGTLSPSIRVLSVILGVLLLIAGVFALKNPLSSLVVLALLIGISWITEGILALTQTVNDSSKWYGTLLGLLSIVAGVVFIFAPLSSLAILTVFAAWTFIVLGVFQAMSAITLGRVPKARLAK